MKELMPYCALIGYLLVTGIPLYYFSKFSYESLGDYDNSRRWVVIISGTIERIIYSLSLISCNEKFIPVWIVFKSVAHWNRWDESKSTGEKDEVKNKNDGRARFHLFLIGSGFNLIYGYCGYLIVHYWDNPPFNLAWVIIFIPLLLNVFSILIALWGREKEKVKKSKKVFEDISQYNR